jgi:CubicO group peptidase (beta-lactamase class C family)
VRDLSVVILFTFGTRGYFLRAVPLPNYLSIIFQNVTNEVIHNFFLLIFSSPIHAQNKEAKLNEVMTMYHSFHMFDGSVLVAENGKVIYKNAFGMANREWNIPNTTDTKFMIGSVS